METHPLLTDKGPLLLRPTLACVLACAGLTPGDRQALWTQQLDFWIQVHRKAGRHKQHRREGRWWVWNSIEEWQAQFPFWSRATLKRTISRSVATGVTLTGNYNPVKYDRTAWYTIDFERLDVLAKDWERSHPAPQNEAAQSEALQSEALQNEPLDRVILSPTIGSKCDHREGQIEPMEGLKVRQPIPETSKDSSENERQRLWSTACKELAMQMTRATYAQWIQPLRLVQVAGRDEPPSASIECPNAYVQEWCQYRLGAPIRRALAGALDAQPATLDVRYVLSEDGRAPAPVHR